MKVMLRVVKGGFAPASKASEDALRKMGLKIGDNVLVDTKKPRNPQFFRMAHALGTMLADNIDKFTGMQYHDVLKALQREARVECDVSTVELGNNAVAEIVTPRSLSFESMGEERFRDFYQAICDYVAREYWQEMTQEQIEAMSDVMTNA